MVGERQLLEMLDEIRRRYDLSILISTHDFNTLHLVDKVILLKSKVLTVGTPDEVLQSEEFRQVFLKPLGKEGNG
jgi:zinc transport system ATP-binding protein